MNRSFKPVFIAAVFAVFSVANAQQAVAPAAPVVTAPAAVAPATPAVPAAPAPAVTAPAVTPAHEAVQAPHAPVAAPAAPAVHAPAAPTAPAAPAAVHAPVVPAAPAAAVEATHTPVAADAAHAEPVAEAPAAQATDSVAVAPAKDSTEIILIIEDSKPKKKKRGNRAPKNDFAMVDVPANFEIQARKVMPVSAGSWGNDNLDEWFGRANLMVLTESENFIGKLHLRMYPGEFHNQTVTRKATGLEKELSPAELHDGEKYEIRDVFQIHEAWAWHRGDYVNLKIGRWDNTTRFGSQTFGGYLDAKKNLNVNNDRSEVRRATGFMSTYAPENALQFGLHNFSENVTLDLALVSSDEHLNRGDLRAYFAFKDLAGLENMNFGIGYRSNVFDEIYSKYGDVVHTLDFAFRMPIVKDAGILKDFGMFVEVGIIGLDDQSGEEHGRDDGGSNGKEYSPTLPILGGLDFTLYRGLDKIVVEAELDTKRKNHLGTDENVRRVQGSIYVQKKLNDRFTLNLGTQTENNTRDFSLAARLQGRIN